MVYLGTAAPLWNSQYAPLVSPACRQVSLPHCRNDPPAKDCSSSHAAAMHLRVPQLAVARQPNHLSRLALTSHPPAHENRLFSGSAKESKWQGVMMSERSAMPTTESVPASGQAPAERLKSVVPFQAAEPWG